MSAGSPLIKQVMVRADPKDHERWKEAAEKNGMTMTDFICKVCNDAASDVLDCKHLNRRIYDMPGWGSDVCLDCGIRFR